jgi:hypothetical protein
MQESNPLDTKLVLLGEEHSGRDEMNLAGNPFALLQGGKSGQTSIKYEWERQLSSGKIVTASWEVNGHPTLGLPGPSEELLYLVLLQITREAAGENSSEWPRTVHFSRYDVLQRMNWPNNPQRYGELSQAFNRLQSVSIQAAYSFHDARSKSPYDAIGFGIIDDFGIMAEPAGKKSQNTIPLSWFRWNETLYNSFLAGNVRSLALEFVLSLDLPTTRRLFRLLDVLRCQTKPPRKTVSMDLFKLRDRLGMTPYAYASKIKEKLRPAIDELTERGYLDSVDFVKSKKIETVTFHFGEVKTELDQVRAEQGNAPITAPTAPKTPPKPQQMALLEDGPLNNVRADALRCYELFQTLPKTEQTELLEIARRDVSPIWHDRVGQPESPMSLGLWQLVADRYPERLK